MPPSEATSELEGLMYELRQSRDAANFVELARSAKQASYRQLLQAEQADWTADLNAAAELYWKLHQEGYLFENQTARVAERLIEAKHPEQAVAVMETFVRNGKKLTYPGIYALAKAYNLTNRPLDAKRVLSEEPQ